MKYKQKLTSKEDVNNLISELHELFPKIKFDDIATIQQARVYFLQLDILTRSELFINTLLEMSDSIIELSDNEKNEFLGFMKTHDVNVKTKFHELLFGNYLKKLNFEVTFQPEYVKSSFSTPENNITLKHRLSSKNNKLVPDWEVKKNNQKSVVEIFTLNEYDDYNDERVFRLLFGKKIKNIEEHYNLHFDFNWSSFQLTESFNDSNLAKIINSIVFDIHEKLQKNEFGLNSHFNTLFGLEVIISHIRLNQTLKAAGFKSPRMIDPFEKKYERYKDLVNQMKMPLILVCVTDCLSRLSCDPFENIILTGIDQASFSPRKEPVINPKNKMPEVSGFMLYDYNLISSQFDITYIPNPNAKYPIEMNINKKCNRKNSESIGWFL